MAVVNVLLQGALARVLLAAEAALEVPFGDVDRLDVLGQVVAPLEGFFAELKLI